MLTACCATNCHGGVSKRRTYSTLAAEEARAGFHAVILICLTRNNYSARSHGGLARRGVAEFDRRAVRGNPDNHGVELDDITVTPQRGHHRHASSLNDQF
jgi:hypothetical protein